jgi:hypothetical protein
MLRSVVDDHEMHGGPVVPESEVARVPVVPNEEPLVHHVLVQEFQEPVTLTAREPLDVGGELRVDEKTPLPGLGMGSHDRMLDRVELGELCAVPLAETRGPDLLTERFFSVVDSDESVEDPRKGADSPS